MAPPVQLALVDETTPTRPVPAPAKSDKEIAFEVWLKEEPWAFDEFLSRARAEHAERVAARDLPVRLSAKKIVEEIRAETRRHINNTWTSFLADLAMDRDPSLRGAFRTRPRRLK